MRNAKQSSSALVSIFLLFVLFAAACSTTSTAKDAIALDDSRVPATMTMKSSAFENNARLPAQYTCDGQGSIPPLAWSAPPATTKTIAIVVDDHDAPDGHYVQWIVVDLPASARSLDGPLPSGAHQLDNTAGTIGWAPPCPTPPNTVHHYSFTVYALNDYVCPDNGDTANSADCDVPSTQEAIPQIAGDALAKGALVGTYSR
jgi:Raf kinase inhibitor-like YbhB/YbcL family protein